MDLRKFRIEHNLTQNEFSNIIGVSRSVYQRWESNKRLPSYTQSASLLNAIKKITDKKDKEYIIACEKYKQSLKLLEDNNIINDDIEINNKTSKIYKYIFIIILIFILVVIY